MLGGCATYDYSAGSAPGGYYTGRPSVEYIGPYSGGYGYGGGYGGLSYGYGGYGGYGYLRPNRGFSGGYYPYYPYRPYYPHPPRPRPDTGNPNPQNPNPPGHGNRPPPWRNPDGRPHQIDQPPRPQYQGGPRPTGRPVVWVWRLWLFAPLLWLRWLLPLPSVSPVLSASPKAAPAGYRKPQPTRPRWSPATVAQSGWSSAPDRPAASAAVPRQAHWRQCGPATGHGTPAHAASPGIPARPAAPCRATRPGGT